MKRHGKKAELNQDFGVFVVDVNDGDSNNNGKPTENWQPANEQVGKRRNQQQQRGWYPLHR